MIERALVWIAALLVGVVALTGAAVWIRQDAYADGEAAERAVWVARQAVAAERQARADAAERARHEGITATYRAHLAGIAADRDGFARRLRHALSAAAPRECPGRAADGAPQSGGEGEGRGAAADAVAGALADYDAACRADAEQLRALIEAVAGPADRRP